VEQEPGADRQPAGRRADEGNHERDGAHHVRGDPREGRAFAGRLARPPQIEPLQRAQAAVNGPLMIEGGAGSEVVALDERRAKAALRGVVCDGQAGDAPADDEQIEETAGEPIEVAGQRPVI